jgi:hypothetical protein
VDRKAETGRFFVQDIYQGLTGVKRGEVKALRVLEETSRVSPSTMGGSPYNQVFLLSAALAFSVKNFLGVVPVDENGSAYFEVPSGRAVFFQALDAEGRTVQTMRTFVQAAPGMTRSCIGCHEQKYSSPVNEGVRSVLAREPSRLQPESWGSGFVDFPGMVQPILDKHCVSCHGGEKDIGGGMDLTGGWTEHFSISYENLISRRQTQLVAYWISGIDCMNGTAHWSAQLFPPRSHGSGAAPLAKLLVEGHKGYIPNLTRTERDVLMAWMDSNGLFHGTWDGNKNGCAVKEFPNVRNALSARMQTAGCGRCHGEGNKLSYFDGDWFNLQDPQFSRILRAPLPKGADGYGLGLCRERKVDPKRQRIHLLRTGYAHAVQPVEKFPKYEIVPPDLTGEPVVSFASTADPNYQAMLGIIRAGREKALATPRVDMPGAEVIAGACRQFRPPPIPEPAVPLKATVDREGVVLLSAERSARTIGLEAEFHRGDAESFTPSEKTLLTRTGLFRHTDSAASQGTQWYAVVLAVGEQRGKPAYASVAVPPPPAPPAPTELKVLPASGAVRLQWSAPKATVTGYNVYRGKAGADAKEMTKLTAEPVRTANYGDAAVELGVAYSYRVRAVSARGVESEPSAAVDATATIVKDAVFIAPLEKDCAAQLLGGEALTGKVAKGAKFTDGALDVTKGGHVTFAHQASFDLTQPLTVECWVYFEDLGKMPIVVSCGLWNHAGWFLQKLGGAWRWHVGGVDCDGGKPVKGKWLHMCAVYDGKAARLFQDGVQIAEKAGSFNQAPFGGELHVGQYSGQPGADFQVTGRVRGVKLYHRALDAAEIKAAAERP